MIEGSGNYNILIENSRFTDYDIDTDNDLILYNSIQTCLLPNYYYYVHFINN